MTLKNSPLVSVLMTVYNRAPFISEAIESVMASTYDNWELIIVDDQSIDNSLEISRKYEAEDERISVYLNDNNLGDYPNRNKAASYAKGKYLKYVDADDMIYPHGLELLVYYMEQFPNAGYGLCSLDQDKQHMFPIRLSPLETYKRHYIKRQSLFHKAPLSSIIRRSVFEAENGFINVRHYGDFELWHRLSKKYDLVMMPKGIAWYRVSDGQEAAVRKKNPLNGLYTLQAAQTHIKSNECPLTSEQKSNILKDFRKTKARLAFGAFKNHGFNKGREFQSAAQLSLIEILKHKIFR
jgi:glycosyltransferase involved in cell wall biosynthesis